MGDHAHDVQLERPEAKDILSKYPGPISWVVTIIIGCIFLGGLAVVAGNADHGDDHGGGGDHAAEAGGEAAEH